eukprot:2372169-Pyramimonas_sp.AAC.1
MERSSKRKIEVETTIKATKKAKPPVDANGEEKTIPENQKQRLEKMKEQQEKGTLDLTTQLSLAIAPDNKGDVPTELVAKAEAANDELAKIQDTMKGLLEKMTAPMGLVGQALDKAKD